MRFCYYSFVKRFFKSFVVFVGSVSFFMFFSFGALANGLVGPSGSDIGGLFSGQSHFYDVIFRGNGEAIVFAKLVVTNDEETVMDEFSFEVPGVLPTELTIFQQILPRKCLEYNYSAAVYPTPCIKYGPPDYFDAYYLSYDNSRAAYRKVSFEEEPDAGYNLTLPRPLQPSESTAFILSYAAKGYVAESLGLYKFEFETLKVSSRIADVRVSVDVDSELFMKGKRSEVTYLPDFKAASSDLAVAENVTTESASMDKFVSNIGSYYGPIVKEAKQLAAGETLVVKGKYAASSWRLHLGLFIWLILVVIAIGLVIYFVRRHFRRKAEIASVSKTSRVGSKTVTAADGKQAAIIVFSLKNLGLGLLTIALVVGFSYFLIFLEDGDWLNSFYYSDLFEIFFFVAVIFVYLLIVFVPIILVTAKRGWRALISLLIADAMWAVVAFVVYIVIFKIWFGDGSSGYDYYGGYVE